MMRTAAPFVPLMLLTQCASATERPNIILMMYLQTDRAETNDLAAEHPEIVREMVAQLQAWRESCRASLRGDDY